MHPLLPGKLTVVTPVRPADGRLPQLTASVAAEHLGGSQEDRAWPLGPQGPQLQWPSNSQESKRATVMASDTDINLTRAADPSPTATPTQTKRTTELEAADVKFKGHSAEWWQLVDW
jgi:hypothetical protein